MLLNMRKGGEPAFDEAEGIQHDASYLQTAKQVNQMLCRVRLVGEQESRAALVLAARDMR